MGVPALECARFLVGSLDLPLTPEEYLDERAKFKLDEYYLEADLMPGGVTRLLYLLWYANEGCYVATKGNISCTQIFIVGQC